jgi:hypothetical protein
MSGTQHSEVGDLSGLPADERARRYRELAHMHVGMSEGAVAEARTAHLELAALWMRLAAQAEHHPPEVEASGSIGLQGPEGAPPA